MSKNAEFHADFESVEKVVKKCTKKRVISKTSFTNMSKSEKSAFVRHVFANNFFLYIFSNFFNGFEISVFLFSGHEPIYFIENKEKTLRATYGRGTQIVDYMD